jgi:hypothetical protein
MGGLMTLAKSASWITAKRLRTHGFLLALCLWSVYLWNIVAPGLFDRAGNLKGTDFLHLYTLGTLALAHRGADLYNMPCNQNLRRSASSRRRRHPLSAAVSSTSFNLLRALARLPYPWALALWLTLSAILYGLCCYALWRACPGLQQPRNHSPDSRARLPAFWHLIAWGQTSALALALFHARFSAALRTQREFLAGLALGCLIFKPQLGVAAAIIFLITIRWKMIAGAIFSAAAELIPAWLYYGPEPLREWLRTLLNVSRMLPLFEPRLYQTHSLRTFWSMLIPWPSASLALYLVSALLVSVLMVAGWRSRLSLPVRYSALLLATVLLAPHLTVYDLVILAPAFLLLSDWIVINPDHSAIP